MLHINQDHHKKYLVHMSRENNENYHKEKIQLSKKYIIDHKNKKTSKVNIHLFITILEWAKQ